MYVTFLFFFIFFFWSSHQFWSWFYAFIYCLHHSKSPPDHLARNWSERNVKKIFTICKAKTKTSCIYHRYFQLELPKNDSSPSSILVFSLYTSYCYRANTYLIVSQNMLVGYRRCRSFRLTCRSCCDRCRMVAFMMVRSCKSILSKIRGTCRNVTEVQTSWSWRKSWNIQSNI